MSGVRLGAAPMLPGMTVYGEPTPPLNPLNVTQAQFAISTSLPIKTQQLVTAIPLQTPKPVPTIGLRPDGSVGPTPPKQQSSTIPLPRAVPGLEEAVDAARDGDFTSVPPQPAVGGHADFPEATRDPFDTTGDGTTPDPTMFNPAVIRPLGPLPIPGEQPGDRPADRVTVAGQASAPGWVWVAGGVLALGVVGMLARAVFR